jgi:hypothetical protein
MKLNKTKITEKLKRKMEEIFEEFGQFGTPNSVYLITEQLNQNKDE